MIIKPEHSVSSTPLTLIHITDHDSNYSTDEGDYSDLLYVYRSIDRFNPDHYGDENEKIQFVQFSTESPMEISVIKKMFNAVTTQYAYHYSSCCWAISIWNDYHNGRSIRIEDRIYQEDSEACKGIDFDQWIKEALEEALFI